nr:MAG TPA: hypothetical protein [Bacteriophage sp.]
MGARARSRRENPRLPGRVSAAKGLGFSRSERGQDAV